MKNAPVVEFDPFCEDFLRDPFTHYKLLRDAGPIFWMPAIGTYGMARYAEVKRALVDHTTFCSGRGVGLSDFSKDKPFRPPSLLLESDPPLHDRTRGLMNKIVSLSALRICRAKWQSVADALVRK